MTRKPTHTLANKLSHTAPTATGLFLQETIQTGRQKAESSPQTDSHHALCPHSATTDPHAPGGLTPASPWRCHRIQLAMVFHQNSTPQKLWLVSGNTQHALTERHFLRKGVLEKRHWQKHPTTPPKEDQGVHSLQETEMFLRTRRDSRADLQILRALTTASTQGGMMQEV